MRPPFRPAKAGQIPVRSAVILVVASVVGAAAGVLTYLASRSLPQALLAAGTATGGAAKMLTQITGTDPERTTESQDNKQHDEHDDIPRQQREA